MQVLNYVQGEWSRSQSPEILKVVNPATHDPLAEVPMSTPVEVHAAIQSAKAAYPAWKRTPPEDRIQYLFKYKQLLEKHFDEIARITTTEHGKILSEARAELRRGIENVEVACGIPILMQGTTLENVASGIDEMMIRQPVGVVAAITPFNFPAMIPLWFLPYAIACGNTFILKPSEKVPLTPRRLFELLQETGLPSGVANLVYGGKPAVDTLLEHPDVRAISFVGSSPVAKYIYATASAHGKRVQCQGGAKNHVVVMPDADHAMTSQIIADSAFGCSGQRCLAVSVAVTVGDAHKTFCEAISSIAGNMRVGNGLDESVQMGPVISAESKTRIAHLVSEGLAAGGRALIDGREAGLPSGNFLRPTVLEGLPEDHKLWTTEIFGPVLSVHRAATVNEAIAVLARSPYGNGASIFTSSGASARQFRTEVQAGNIGINVGVAAPMAYFPFSGWKDSFLGTLHGQGHDAVEFYTEKKVVIERWPSEWSRRF